MQHISILCQHHLHLKTVILQLLPFKLIKVKTSALVICSNDSSCLLSFLDKFPLSSLLLVCCCSVAVEDSSSESLSLSNSSCLCFSSKSVGSSGRFNEILKVQQLLKPKVQCLFFDYYMCSYFVSAEWARSSFLTNVVHGWGCCRTSITCTMPRTAIMHPELTFFYTNLKFYSFL